MGIRIRAIAVAGSLMGATATGGQTPEADCGVGPAAAVTIDGFRARTGLLTVYLWSDSPTAFLEHGRSLRRIELPVPSRGPARICLRAPSAGRYAVSVRHDVDGNRARYDLDDGAGFSRNPRLSLTRTRPALATVLVVIGEGAVPVGVVMNYRFGLSVRPVAGWR